MAFISQHIQISNHYDVYLKLMQYNIYRLYLNLKKTFLKGTATKKSGKTGQKTWLGNSKKNIKTPHIYEDFQSHS